MSKKRELHIKETVSLLQGMEIFSSYRNVQTGYGAHTASHLWVQAVLSPGKRLLGRKVNHSPLSSAEIQNKWRYTSITPTCVDGVDRENLTFSLISRKEDIKTQFIPHINRSKSPLPTAIC
jgi:hypothetical protein